MPEQSKIPRVNRRRFLQILAVAGVAGGVYRFGFSGAAKDDHLVRQSRSLMGTEINLIVRGPDEDACLAAVRATFDRIAVLSRIFSRHDPASELAELNRSGTLQAISSELGEVLTLATSISLRTNGAFDVTVLPLLRLYEQTAMPGQDQLDAALEFVDYRRIERQGQRVRMAPGMELTLDGIAKGYIVDQGIATLHAHGFANVYVEAGGDLMVTGSKPADQPWRIGIQPPRPQSSATMAVISATSSLAVATSGDYMQAFSDDLRNHHILDPRSGRSPAELASATITAPTVALADGLATAAMVLGPEQALRVLPAFEHCHGLLIGKDLRQYRSTGFPGKMQTITIRRGLDLPITGEPEQTVRPGQPVERVAVLGADYLGCKPTMLVREGEQVLLGQPLFADKANPGVLFVAPGSGTVESIQRGAKRVFEALIIQLDGKDEPFAEPIVDALDSLVPESIRQHLLRAGLWCSFRTRPFGRIPQADATPASLFVTAIDSNPLASDPAIIIARSPKLFRTGLLALRRLLSVPIHLCSRPHIDLPGADADGITSWGFSGPHPAGLASTHIHHIDPVHAGKQVWHIDYQDVLAIGHLFAHGRLNVERIVALGGPGVVRPGLLATRIGASVPHLCHGELAPEQALRILSGSVLDGRPVQAGVAYLGRYHRQVSVLFEGDGRSLFGWLAPGSDRFSVTRLFASSLARNKHFAFLTAVWGGQRAIYPLGVYERVLPLDMIATTLLKTLAIGDCEKAADLGCLELVEEDLALCSFVCPGKNEFGPMLRSVLTIIEQGG